VVRIDNISIEGVLLRVWQVSHGGKRDQLTRGVGKFLFV